MSAGDFAENVTTEGILLPELPVGARFRIGEAVLEVTQIGKECHTRCAIYHQAGDCVMPREGIFARVVEPGEVSPATPSSGYRKNDGEEERGPTPSARIALPGVPPEAWA